jgi:hypothetical protein
MSRNTVTLDVSGFAWLSTRRLRAARAERRATLWALLVAIACAALVLA